MIEDRGVCGGITRNGSPCRARAGVGGWCSRHVPVEVVARRKIGIVGFTHSLHDAPWGDPEWELWGCNNLHKQLRPEQLAAASGWFDLHDRETINADEGHVDWLCSTEIPVLTMFKPPPEWKSAFQFPRDELLEWGKGLGLSGWRYYTNSISWMVAFAAMRLTQTGDGGDIGVWGVDLAQATEYGQQRPSAEYWLGVANGLGLTLTIAKRSDLLKCASMYGDEAADDLAYKMRARQGELHAQIEQVNAKVAQMLSELEQTRYVQHQLAGAYEDTSYYLNVWMQPDGPRKGGADPYSTEAAAPEHVGA